MSPKMKVAPGAIVVRQAKISIIVVSLFLIFGLIFGFAVLFEASWSEPGLTLLISAFFLIWTVVCIALIIFNILLIKKSGKNEKDSIADILVEEPAAPSGDFESRLRQLERLRIDKLITEEEYLKKRSQILQEKW